MISTANSGVASRLPFWMVNSFWPSYSVVDGMTLPHDPEHEVLLRMDLGLVVAGDLPRRESRNGTEDDEHPLERLDQGDAGEDEHGPQDEGTEDAPEQHPELVLGRARRSS